MPRNQDMTKRNHAFARTVMARVRRISIRRDVTMRSLARSVGYHHTTLTNMAAGRMSMPACTLWDFANALDVPIEELVPRPKH